MNPCCGAIDAPLAIAQAEVETIELPSKLYDIAFFSQDGQELIISTTRPELIPACVFPLCQPLTINGTPL